MTAAPAPAELLLRALAGESSIELSPQLSIHVAAGGATLPPGADSVDTLVPAPASPHVHRVDAASATECERIVGLVEAHLAAGGALTTDRHGGFPTTDIPISHVPGLAELAGPLLQSSIAPRICEAYGLPPGSLVAHDLFVVVYSAEQGGQRALATHQDESHFSFNLLLTPASEFDGGGTWFEHLDATITLEQGQLCCHPGELRHRGVEITRGRRMLLVGFLQDRRRALFDRELPAGLQSVVGQEAGRRLRSEWEGHNDAG